ncbi:hypothetical protein [Mycolicibacterium arenosum]|uniref:Uncharacterized protein n=1 Tax=Mycolicibacterium arenosum TaxID=2952157 RepID=A0ABT1LXN4_9MYCO|nr:hypothetical protein [Mycolicibacterium sp. CAU 1645]MCP9271661.1 hypothetical protein [Mycolicibacterium sp. CAU 1645]
MNAPPAQLSVARRSSIFTLGSALRWLGHECVEPHCSEPFDDMAASIWFLRRGAEFGAPPDTLILVDTRSASFSSAGVRRVLYQVNCCTLDEAIVVCRGW